MRALETITQVFDRCAAARVKASLVLCIAAFISSPLPAQAETAALQYDNNGNITQRSVTNGTTTQTTTYTYDALNRLTGESGPAKTQTITYDENGNRLSDGAGSYVYETTSNRMSTRLGLAVTFDAAGNMTADGTGRTFTYNEFNQMDQVFQGSTLIATYEYDANGLRLSKTTTASAPQGAQTVVYIHDQWGKIMEEFTGTDTLIRSYIWRGDTPVAQIEHTSGGDKILHFDPDHLNTPRAAMDETGKVVWRWESDAFGSTLPNEDADGDGNLTTINMRFGGYYADVESGLFYAMHRYYSPLLKIFTQTDRLDLLRQAVNPLYAQYSEPTDLQKALNQPYQYVGGNPLRYIDPLGLWRSPSDIYDDAFKDTQSKFPRKDIHNGPGDAYRHCLASCMMASEDGSLTAQILGWANEKRGDWTHNQERGEREMDDHNNAYGRQCAKDSKGTKNCQQKCLNAVTRGDLKTYSPGTTPGYRE